MKNVIELKIDPEFQSQIPPLTDEEFKQLQDNILEDGEVYEPIIVWNETIIDGHNRWKIIKEHWDVLKDSFRIKKMTFADKWAAFDWMFRKQLGRRNLTEGQKSYLIGKMYETRKQKKGGNHGNQYSKVAKGQNVPLPDKKTNSNDTATSIGKEFGMTARSVKRAEKFAKGVDALMEVSADAARKVLNDESSATNAQIMGIPQMESKAIEEIAQAIVNGDPIPRQAMRPEYKPRGWTKADREERAKLDAIAADMYDRTTVPEYTVDSLVDDIQLCAQEFVQQIKNTLKDRSTVLTDESKPIIADAIDLYIIKEIEKVRSLLK